MFKFFFETMKSKKENYKKQIMKFINQSSKKAIRVKLKNKDSTARVKTKLNKKNIKLMRNYSFFYSF